MYMILFVLHDPARLKEIMSAWNEAGVSGVTILPSTGLKRLQEHSLLRDDLPLIPSLEDLLDHEETLNRTLFTIVPSEKMVDNVVAAKDAVSQKATDVKESVVHAAQTVKADAKAGIKKMGQVHQDVAAGAGKVASDVKQTGHNVAEKVKHH
mgnify:CR=1 FL=1